MSIKGSGQELYVGKEESNIIGFGGKKNTIRYANLSRIDFSYFRLGRGGGNLDFIDRTGSKIRFSFNYKVNEKISRTIELIKENNPELEINEYRPEEYKFYQCDWFIILMLFCCCFPLGLFLMWYYKKYDKSIRILLTSFFVFMWAIAIFVMWPRTYNDNITLAEYNQCNTGMTYQDCVKTIGSEGEPLAETSILDITSTSFVWYGDSTGTSVATLYFTNDELTTKAQIGLK